MKQLKRLRMNMMDKQKEVIKSKNKLIFISKEKLTEKRLNC